jgi:hypothetical protein
MKGVFSSTSEGFFATLLFEFSHATNSEANITGLVFNAHDITKRKAYEDEITAQHTKLVE